MAMTMADGKCEVCGEREPIGVASTHAPLSVAYCIDCARAHADPEVVFETWAMEGVSPDDMHEGLADQFCTWKDGKFISYRDWWHQRKASLT
jgi:hypothetical protein